jgi:hypothetical protein
MVFLISCENDDDPVLPGPLDIETIFNQTQIVSEINTYSLVLNDQVIEDGTIEYISSFDPTVDINADGGYYRNSFERIRIFAFHDAGDPVTPEPSRSLSLTLFNLGDLYFKNGAVPLNTNLVFKYNPTSFEHSNISSNRIQSVLPRYYVEEKVYWDFRPQDHDVIVNIKKFQLGQEHKIGRPDEWITLKSFEFESTGMAFKVDRTTFPTVYGDTVQYRMTMNFERYGLYPLLSDTVQFETSNGVAGPYDGYGEVEIPGNYSCNQDFKSKYLRCLTFNSTSQLTRYNYSRFLGNWSFQLAQLCINYNEDGTGLITYKNGLPPESFKWGIVVNLDGSDAAPSPNSFYVLHEGDEGDLSISLALVIFDGTTFLGWEAMQIDCPF